MVGLFVLLALTATSLGVVDAFAPSPEIRSPQTVVPTQVVLSYSSTATVVVESSQQPLPLLRNHGAVVSLLQQPSKAKKNMPTTPKRQQQLVIQHTPFMPRTPGNGRTTLSSSNNNNNNSNSPSLLLSHAQEIDCSNRIRTYRAALSRRDQLQKTSLVVTESAWAAACSVSVPHLRRLLAAGQEARCALVAANIGLVTAISKRLYYGMGGGGGGDMGTILTLADMIQEGNLGLMEAAERYEPERGFRFSTYATWWVRQRILRSIEDQSRTIRLPAHVHGMLLKMKRARADIKSELGRDPTAPELALHLQVKESKVQAYQNLAARNVVLSLERPLRTDHDDNSSSKNARTLADTLASDAPTPEEDAQARDIRAVLWGVMDTALVDKERQVIVKRFGLEDGKPRTVQETAQLLDISRDRVRLVEARALNKLRHPQRKYKLKEYYTGGTGVSTQSRGHSTSGAVGVDAEDDKSAGGARSDRIWFF
jgi:RNA polymerase primary sigma factor